jgi:hypothetical protein
MESAQEDTTTQVWPAHHDLGMVDYKALTRLSHLQVLAVIKCIYLQPTYLHFIQYIEDRCLLLMSSTSFVDLPFQEHWMIEKHHMDQNPYISSSCPKPGVVTDHMTRGDNVAQNPGPVETKWGRPAWVWRHFQIHLQHVST